MQGVEFDVHLGPAMARLSASLDGLSGRMDRTDKRFEEMLRREAARARTPADVRLFTSATIPTPTARTGLNFGGPESGYYWLLRRLVIGGVNFKDARAGTAEVYVTALSGPAGSASTGPIIAGLGLTDMVDQFASLPTTPPRQYSNRQVIIQEQENLVVVIDSGTQAVQYVAACQFELHRTVVGETIYT